MAAKKCKCGRKLILEMDKVRGRCYECVREERDNKRLERRRGRQRGPSKGPYMKSFLVLLLPFVLFGCGSESDAATQKPLPKAQEDAVAAIKKLGGSVARGDTTGEVTMVLLNDTQIMDAGLSELKAALPIRDVSGPSSRRRKQMQSAMNLPLVLLTLLAGCAEQSPGISRVPDPIAETQLVETQLVETQLVETQLVDQEGTSARSATRSSRP